MAPPRVALCALCVLRAALATVYFQEQFLDGGDRPGGPLGRAAPSAAPRTPGHPDPPLFSPPTHAEHWRNRWVPSTNDSAFGHFRLSSGKFYGHIEKDKGGQQCRGPQGLQAHAWRRTNDPKVLSHRFDFLNPWTTETAAPLCARGDLPCWTKSGWPHTDMHHTPGGPVSPPAALLTTQHLEGRWQQQTDRSGGQP